MYEAFIFTFLVILALIGLGETFYSIGSFILKPQKIAQKVLVLFLTEPCAEQQLISAMEEQKWSGNKHYQNIVAVTNNITPATQKALINTYKDQNVYFTHNDNFIKEFENIGVFSNAKQYPNN